jgi:hypothetical protein
VTPERTGSSAEGSDRVDVVNRMARNAGVGLVCATALIALGGSATAYAAPADGQGQPSCAYTLSKPFLVEVSGRKMVSATFSSLPCTEGILPNDLTVCVELQGGGAPQCFHQGGYNPAQVYFAPYRPGATYTSTGTGCGSVGPLYVSVCATQGPYSATL